MQILTFAAIDIGSYEVGMKILNWFQRVESGRLIIYATELNWGGMPIIRAGLAMNS